MSAEPEGKPAAPGDAPAEHAGAVAVGPGRLEEAEAIGQVCIDAYSALGHPLRPEYAAELFDVAGRMADPNAVVLAARIGGQVVGHATVVIGPSSLANHVEPGEASLRMVAVAPRWQGHGAGRALVEESLAVSRRAGCAWMRLYTQPFMVSAQRLYDALGFRRVPERDTDVLGGTMHLIAYELRL